MLFFQTKEPFQIPTPIVHTTAAGLNNRSSNKNFADANFYYKYPSGEQISLLINEFLALKITRKLADLANFTIHIPQVWIDKNEQDALFLKIEKIQDYKSLADLKKENNGNLDSQKIKDAILESLILDLIVGNTDGNDQNIGRDSSSNYWHIDFDHAFRFEKTSIEDQVKEMRDGCYKGFPIQSFLNASIKDYASNLFEKLKNLSEIANLNQEIRICITAAIKELEEFQVTGSHLDQETQNTNFIMNQLRKISDIPNENLFIQANTKCVPPTPAKPKPNNNRYPNAGAGAGGPKRNLFNDYSPAKRQRQSETEEQTSLSFLHTI